MSKKPSQDPKAQEDTDIRAALDKLRDMRYPDAVQGKEIYNFMGGRVIEHRTSKSDVLAIKVNSTINRSEGDMMHYAAMNGVRAPRVRGVYDIVGTRRLARAMVSERVPGVPLADVWQTLSAADKSTIKDQLRTQLARMRACTQPFIGRVGRQKTRNVYDGFGGSYCGPFADEKAFDDWCLAHIPGGPLMRFKWRWLLESERKNRRAASFVLTHGDLTPRNIIVQGNVIMGIVDWERSGFFPEYAEYAFAMMLCPSHEEWWIPVLMELLPPCSKRRLEFTGMVDEWFLNS
ncbi:hypothetical protein DL764_000370 [Monosporascus ibericus]|uniref:Aminoglycoside phosphotransferase domain-containing protein n=1 Tax=Monosporascus ibericus TaxID=155417 RepID=A0A4Q4TWF1_9PEZI|nr:hypothetical protein DL764_000370 [Monosporascus ibericus]